MPCNRDRKHRFILSFGKINAHCGNEGVTSALIDFGLEAFEEWALDAIIADLIKTERSRIKRNRENRVIYASYVARHHAAPSPRAAE